MLLTVDLHILSLPSRRGGQLDRAIASTDGQGARVTVWPVDEGSSIGARRAAALAAATAEYVAYLDDDDHLLPGAVAACLDTLAAHPRAVGAFTDEVIQTEDGTTRPGAATGTGPWSPLHQLITPRYGRHLAVIRRAAVLPHLAEMSQWPTLSEYVLRGLVTDSGPWIHVEHLGYVLHDHPGPRGHHQTTPALLSRATRLIAPVLMRWRRDRHRRDGKI